MQTQFGSGFEEAALNLNLAARHKMHAATMPATAKAFMPLIAATNPKVPPKHMAHKTRSLSILPRKMMAKNSAAATPLTKMLLAAKS